MTLHRSSFRQHRPIAACATLALIITGVFASTPAFAEDSGPSTPTQRTTTVEDTPLKVDAEYDADATDVTNDEKASYTPEGTVPDTDPEPVQGPPSRAAEQRFEAAGVDLVGVGVNANGDTVVVTTGGDIDSPAGQSALEEFASSHDEDTAITTIELEGPVTAAVSKDLVGGSGYIALNSVTDGGGYCSLGFAAWSPSRKPAFITAGHCKNGTEDNVALATTPAEEPAAGGSGTPPVTNLPKIGWFEFAQYGGPGGTPGTNGGADSIDIATIDVDADDGWILKPEVTDWTTPGQSPSSLAESTTKIERVGLPEVGPIARSGRTSGKQVGSVRPIDILDGWIQVSGRWVHGFSSSTFALPGDSGGPVFQGTTAVGVVSGIGTEPGGGTFLWSSLLQEDLPTAGGYEVALDIASPTIDTPTAIMGEKVAVTTPENATGLTVAVNGQESIVTPVNGVAHISGPTPGHYAYTLTATNGMSRSEPVTQTVTIAPPAPTITSLEDDAVIENATELTTISGTGVEGATVDVTLTALTIYTPGAHGPQENSAQAPLGDQIQTVSNYTSTVQGGVWSIEVAPVGSAMVTFNLAATQTVNDVNSAESLLSFTMVGERQQEEVTPVTPPVKPIAKQSASLAQTGSSSLATMGLVSGAALMLGALLLVAVGTRHTRRHTR